MATVWLESDDCLNDTLPDVCLRCGHPTSGRMEKSFIWVPAVAGIGGLPLWLLAAIFARKTWKINVPICERHRNHWMSRRVAVFLSLALFVVVVSGLIFLGRVFPESVGMGIVGVILMTIVLLILVVLITQTAIRPIHASDEGVQLVDVHKSFVAAYRQQQEQRARDIDKFGEVSTERWGDRRLGGTQSHTKVESGNSREQHRDADKVHPGVSSENPDGPAER